ncbi:MAG: 4-hydroxy-tetrahydrodipicolinate synthase [Bacteroidales bacterium]|nr:4-hydroxy-tetrahydrodipicolinate synthase [Bacteroidales bacterium]MBO6220488.1 4-hydroxy-tetrahydrodipicolinate synthase [Bacteroidales bacterium]MBO6248710.1 4-hydroxy-tetrahydrodipicolinate synthase [Bacteroidales bacterium]
MTLRGCGTALATPFKNGKVDFEAYKRLVARQVEAGIHFLVPLGSTAETPCLENDEKIELLKITRELCPDRPVVAGVGTNSPVATIRNIQLLEPYGPDAWLVVVPYYNKPTQQGLYEYFKAIAESTDKPIVAYNVPGRTGTNMTAETTLRIAQIPGIIAVKEASGKLDQIEAVVKGRHDGFKVLSGNDDQTFPIMRFGGDGIISVASNVAPGLMVEMVEAAESGDWAKAEALDKKLAPLYDACFVESNPIPAKAALSVLGLCEPEMRLPLTTAVPSTFETMRKVLEDLGI